jgi:hypothetical protein
MTSHFPSSIPKAQLSQTRVLTVPLRGDHIPSTSLPTHVIALSPARASSSSSSEALLFPIHAIMLAINCPNLPRIPGSSPHVSSNGTVTLPVIQLSVPSPSAFPTIQNYLYAHDSSALLMSLVGGPLAVPPSFLALISPSSQHSPGQTVRSTLASGQKLHQLSAHLCAAAGGLQSLMARATTVVGVWRTVVALGIADPEMWDVLDLSWEVLLGAMNLAAGV